MAASARNILQDPCLHFADGVFFESTTRETFSTVNPATGRELAKVARGKAEDVDRAVNAANRAYKEGPWPRLSFSERSTILNRVASAIADEHRAFAELECLDTGKPISETMNGDIARVILNFRFFSDLATRQSEPTFVSDDGSVHRAVRESMGVCGLITPWNLPLYLATWKIAPALMQGNTVVLKPAELTPLSANALAKVMNDCGLPPGVFNIVHGFGEGEAGEALVAHPDVRSISFTGETGTGRAIMRRAADTLKKVSFELGGKGASVIFADADLSKAIPTAANAAFRNQGQICLAGSRLIVEKSIAPEVIKGVVAYAKHLRCSDPLDETTSLGALISKEHRDRVASYVELARQEGCTILCGGQIPKGLEAGAFYEPTVITGVAQKSRLIQEEVFGPVLTVQTFETPDEALGLLNGTPYGLSCSIWTSDQSRMEQMSRSAKTGLVWQNTWFVRNLNAPFGGMKQSGIGREGGQYALDFFSDWKTITRVQP